MPLMNIFEPLFLLLVVVTVATLVTTAVRAARGDMARAGRLLRRLVIGMVLYVGVVIAVSALSPRREYRVGDTQCFDDWCIAVVDAPRRDAPGGVGYDVSLRLSNHARGVPMGEKGTVVYLTDAEGHRYDPAADPEAVPFDTLLQPGASVVARRHFDLPRGTGRLGLVYTHQGGFPIGWFIIGEGGWFQPPPIVHLD